MESLSACESVFRALDAKLRPIGERPIATGKADWAKELASRPHPLDEVGERDRAERLLAAITELYVISTDADRTAIRDLFQRYRYVSWAVGRSIEPMSEERFQSVILEISMKDQGLDARDALLAIWSACRKARAAGVSIEPILEAVAKISSDEDRYGMGSMRAMLRDAPHRLQGER